MKRIEASAFLNCQSLANIKMPNSIEEFGYNAFGSTGFLLDKSNFENGYLYVGDNRVLLSVIPGFSDNCIIKDGTRLIADGAMYKSQINSVTIPDSVKVIGRDAFYNCTFLEDVKFGKGLRTIGVRAFADCESLKSITIPEGVTNIEPQAFEFCRNLKDVMIPGSLPEIKFGVFDFCESLENVTMSNGVKVIGDSAFSYCISLKKITIPESVMYIDDHAFNLVPTIQAMTIIGKRGSYAEKYARKNNIKFKEE